MFGTATRKKDIIGIDLSAEDFQFAHVRRAASGYELFGLATYRIKDVPEEDVGKMVHKAMKDCRAKDPFVVCCLPLHLAITKNLEVPSLDAREIKEIIDLQAGRQTPYARDEIIVDYISLGTYRQNYTKILLVIVPKNVIKKQLVLLDKAGIVVDEVCFGAEGIAGFCYDQVKNRVRNDPFGIIHIDGQTSDMLVCHRGNILFARSIPVGVAHQRTDAAKFTERFLSEIRKSLEMYQAEDIDRVFTQLVITGAESVLATGAELLRSEMQMDVLTLEYRQRVSQGAKNVSGGHAAGESSLLGVVAPLVCAQPVKVSLLPEEVKLKRAFEIRTRALVTFGILLLILGILGSAVLISRVYFKGMYLARLAADHDSVRQEAQILEQAMERIRIVKYHRRNRGYVLEVLAAVYDVLPSRIMLTEIKLDTSGILSLRGTARAMSDVFSFVAALEEREMFRNVQTNFTTARKQGNEDWADFGLSCAVRSREEMSPAPAENDGGDV